MFKKIDIYNRNTQLIAEGRYRSLPTIIQYTPHEQLAISEMIYSLQFSYLENYLSTECINEVFEDEIFNDAIFEGAEDNASKVKILLQKGKDKIEEFIKRLVDKIPESIKKFYNTLTEIAKSGIKTAKDLIKKVGKILLALGDKLEDALEKLGLYRKEVSADIQGDQLSNDISNSVVDKLTGDENKVKMNKFIVSAVYKGYNNKSIASAYGNVNESFTYNDYEINEEPETLINEGLFSWLGDVIKRIFSFDTEKVLKDSEDIGDDTFKTQFVADTSFATKNKTAKQQIIDFVKKLKDKSIKSSQDELDFKKKCAEDFIKDGEKAITKDCLNYVISLSRRLKRLGEKLKDEEAISLYRKLSELIEQSYKNDKKTLDAAIETVNQQTEKLDKKFNNSEHETGEEDNAANDDKNDGEKKGIGKKIVKGAVVAGALASTTVSLLPIALLAGGYLTYKTLKWIGPKLSNKLEPFLLSDKTKAFVDKLYNNPITKYGLGLSKKDDITKEESKLAKFWKMAKSILVNLVIATIISSLLGLFISNIFSGVLGATAISLIVASMLAAKNIAGTIFNRVLNFSKETKTKDGKKISNNFFDIMTLVSILASVLSVVLQIPGVKEWFAKVFEKLRDTNIKDVANAVKEKTGYYINGKFVKVEQTPTENIIVPDNNEAAPIVVEPESKQPYTVDKNGQPEQVGWDKVAEVAPEAKAPDPIGIMYRTEEGKKLVDNMEYCSEPWMLDFTDKATGKTTGYNMANGVMVDQMQKLHINDGCVRAQFFRGNDGNGYLHVFLAQDEVTLTDIYKYGSQISATKEINGAGIEAIINIGKAEGVTKDNCTEFINFFLEEDNNLFDVVKHAKRHGTELSREIVLNRDTGEVVKAVIEKI